MVRVRTKSLEVGRWYSIIAMRKRGRCEIIVDGKTAARKSFLDSGRLFLEAPIMIGAPIGPKYFVTFDVQTGFSGCLNDVRPIIF